MTRNINIFVDIDDTRIAREIRNHYREFVQRYRSENYRILRANDKQIEKSSFEKRNNIEIRLCNNDETVLLSGVVSIGNVRQMFLATCSEICVSVRYIVISFTLSKLFEVHALT